MRYLLLLLSLTAASLLTAQTTERFYLSGTSKDNTIDWEFYCTAGRQSGRWTTIPVPSQWELQGFGTYNYGQQDTTTHAREEGRYRYRFVASPRWRGKAINLVFDGVMTDATVRLNGQPVGPTHQGSFYRFRYDVSELLRPGEGNLLEVDVKKFSDAPSVNQAERYADYWIFGGIFRPVWLEVLPEEHIEHLAVDARANGTLGVTTRLKHRDKADNIALSVRDLNGNPVLDTTLAIPALLDTVSMAVRVPDVLPWSAEDPNLYDLTLHLRSAAQTLHTVQDRIGFRTVELRPGDGIYVNGVKVKFRGVNRHCFWPETGRTTSPAVDRMDIAAIKGMNMNAVRMSHYAPDESFLRLADSAGLYIIDELAGWQQAYSTKIGTPLVRELVERDVNRPSVVLWANGNEGGSNHELLPLYAKYDPQQRTVIHPWGMVNDTDTKHYKPFDCCAGSQFHGETVFFPTEFLHGLYDGGHGASLNEYWEAMYQHPLSAGGFLWNLADEGVVRTDRNGVLDTYGNYGADGILGPHREKEGSYYTIREIWSPLQLKTKRLPTHWDGRLQLENRFHRTNLADCTLTAVLVRYPSSTDVLGNDLLALPTTPLPNLLPGTMGFHQLALPENYAAYHALEVAAFRPNGQLLHGWTLPIQRPAAVAEALLSGLTKLGTVRVDTQGAAITLTVANHQLSIVKASGQLQQFSRPGNTAPITAGPVIATDTIGRHAMGYTLSALPDGGQRVSFTFADGFRKLNWALHPNGIAELDYAFAPKEGGKYIRMQLDYIGLNFTLPETEIAGISYLGGGPHRVYKNRMRGPRMGQYYKAYNDAMTGAAWEYPEFKGYYRDLYWARFHGREGAGDFSLISASENVFLRLYTPRLPDDARPGVSPPYPAGDVSLMHAIPPIGTKFKLPDQLGPAGAPQFYSPSPTDDLFYRGRFYLQLEE